MMTTNTLTEVVLAGAIVLQLGFTASAALRKYAPHSLLGRRATRLPLTSLQTNFGMLLALTGMYIDPFLPNNTVLKWAGVGMVAIGLILPAIELVKRAENRGSRQNEPHPQSDTLRD